MQSTKQTEAYNLQFVVFSQKSQNPKSYFVNYFHHLLVEKSLYF
jgi:hypothetical protein